jgi:hypothetical protein
VAALTEGVLKTMFVARAQTVMVLVAGITFLAAGAGVIIGYAQTEKLPEAQSQAAAKAVERPIPFQQIPLTADDIIAETGLNVYNFRLQIPKGQKFELRLRELPAKDAPEKGQRRFIFEKVTDGPLTARLSFLRRDRQLRGVLLSQEEDAEFRVTCEGCSPTGLATIVPNPLYEVPPTEKTLMVLRSDKDWKPAKQGSPVPLLVIHESKNQPEQRALDAIYPRAELVVIMPPEG